MRKGRVKRNKKKKVDRSTNRMLSESTRSALQVRKERKGEYFRAKRT